MDLAIENNISETGAYVILFNNRQYLIKLFPGRSQKVVKEESKNWMDNSFIAMAKEKDLGKLMVSGALITSCKRKRAAKPSGAPKGA